MREFHTPAVDTGPVDASLTEAVATNAALHPDAVAFRVRGPGGWQDVTTATFRDHVVTAAKGLVAGGVAAGDRVGLLSSTRYEWAVHDYALWWVGAVSVPLYTSSGYEQVHRILDDAGAAVLLVETDEHRVLAQRLLEELPTLDRVWSISGEAHRELTGPGAAISDDDLEARRTAVSADDLASLVYTSGTTGTPRGCMLTHANFLEGGRAALTALGDLFESGAASTLMFLPLPHIFARTVQVAAVEARVTLGHTARTAQLREDLASFRPTFFLAVPRVFEQLYNTTSQRAVADGWGRRFVRASETAIAYSRALDSGRVSPLLRARHALYERDVYPRLRRDLGGRCTHGVSGGAPLGARLAHFYRGIGVPLLEGYGLTETTSAVTVNSPSTMRVGTVGHPLPGTSVRVSDDGELLVRGPQVMRGYWNASEATASVSAEDGWLRTGDVGEIDAEGYVTVTGRKVEILVTAGGKSVAPEPIEARIRAHELVSQCMVVGDGRPFLAALLTLDPAAAASWARAHGEDRTRLPRSARLRAELQRAVDEANAHASQAESVRRFLVLPEEWTEDAGELTASLKLRRRVILAQLRDRLEDLFGS